MAAKITVVRLRMAGLEEPANEWTKAGHEVTFIPLLSDPNDVYPDEELVKLCLNPEIVINDGRQYISSQVMDRLPRLHAIVVPFIGVDKIDVPAATGRNILVVNSPSEELLVSVAEAAILLILALNKRLRHDENVLRAGKWGTPEDRNDILYGRTVGIIGLGRTGRHVAQRFQGWDVRILASDPYVKEVPTNLQGQVELVDLETLLRESDFVCIQAVLTNETRHLISHRELQLMKPTAYLINVARGAIVDEAALVDAIERGTIAGAGLDTFEPEPLPMSSRLRELDPERVILTPHNLPHSREAIAGNMRMFAHNVLELAAGRVPEQVVNKEAIPAWQKRFAAQVR